MVPSNDERIAVLEIQHEQLTCELKHIRADVAEIKQAVTYDRIDNNEHESGLIAEWTEE